MRCFLMCFVALLMIETLKADNMDFARKSDNLGPIHKDKQNKANEATMQNKIMSYQNPLDHLDAYYLFDENNPEDKIDKISQDQWSDGESNENVFKPITELDEGESARLSDYLVKLLLQPGGLDLPMIITNVPSTTKSNDIQGISKRSRYYRQYPWKREHARTYTSLDYDPYNGCTPSRRDVYQLLAALDEARQGNKARIVNFCNRRRPASSVYMNIRFLGRRK